MKFPGPLRGALAIACIAFANACTMGMIGGTPATPRTRAERSDYRETSRYADVVAFLDSLKGRPELAFGSIGRTNEGREIPYVIASRPRVSTPEEARRLGRPVVYVQGNIHAGEIEGKEALQALLRDLTGSRRKNALDSVVLIAVPIYNADGNDKFGSQEVNRGSQNGPEMVGVRANAQGLDLNRDYIKAEASETRGSLAMFTAWKPDVFVDLHTTNGSYHGYALTYAPSLNPASPLGAFTRDSLLPVLRQRMRAKRGVETFDYGDFISDDTLSKGWVTFDSRPRFGTNYFGLRGGISILSEAYSHDPMKRRVAATYAFVGEVLSLTAERATRIKSLVQATESRATPSFVQARSADLSPTSGSVAGQEVVPIRSRMVAAPGTTAVIAELMERTGDSSRTQPGVPKGRRRTGRFTEVRMPVFDRFDPTMLQSTPEAYVIAPADTQIVRILRLHGVEIEPLPRVWTGAVQTFVIDSAMASTRAFQGHREMRLEGKWTTAQKTLAPGSLIVHGRQPLGILAVYLLDPQSDDGLVTWNYFDSAARPGMEFPVRRVTTQLLSSFP